MPGRGARLRLAALGLALVVLGGCSVDLRPNRTLTLQITGTKGVQVAGQYILSAGAHTIRYPLDRELPIEVELVGDDLSCMVQKLGGEGTVRVQLLVDGAPVAFGWTKDRFGNISLTTP